MASVRDLAATTATPHGTRGPLGVLAWRRVCGSSGGLVRGLMHASKGVHTLRSTSCITVIYVS